jgi:putative Ca2+/H+ antiporter (TMEM165/GDT1 family)
MWEYFSALVLIFIAEMGDKTQILAMTFATKYKIKQVVLGVFIGSLLNHSLAVLLGANLQYILPLDTLGMIAGTLFLIFGLWSFHYTNEEEEQKVKKYGPVVTVSLAFFIGELGDKTQLTATILSSDATYPLLILLGTVSGMVLTSLIGIFVGIKLGNKVDEFYIKIAAGFVFIGFGLVKLLQVVPDTYINSYSILSLGLSLAIISIILIYRSTKVHNVELSFYQKTAQLLKDYYSHVEEHIIDICLGEHNCGTCIGNKCLLGYTKQVLKKAKQGTLCNDDFALEDLKLRDFDTAKVKHAYEDTIETLKDHWEEESFACVHQVRHSLEIMLFGHSLEAKNYETYVKQIKSLS